MLLFFLTQFVGLHRDVCILQCIVLVPELQIHFFSDTFETYPVVK